MILEMNKKIPVIIPSLDPDDRLLNLLSELTNNGIKNIVLVNDGSDTSYDFYFEIAKEKYNCTVITHKINMGKGRALKDAFQFCIDTYPDLIGCVTADSDGQHSVCCIKQCMLELYKFKNSLILGVRDFSKVNIPWKSKFGNKLTATIIRYLCGIYVSDSQTGLRGIPKEFMRKLLSVAGERFEFETQMLIETVGGIDIREVQIETIYDSVDNHTTHFDPIKDSIRIYKIFGKIFIKYIISSFSSSILDLVLFVLFEKLFRIYVPDFTFYVAGATVLARVMSGIYNYIINYVIVFRSKATVQISALKYVCLAIVQMVCSAFFTTSLVMALKIPDVVAKVIIDTLLFFISYYIQRRFVFK